MIVCCLTRATAGTSCFFISNCWESIIYKIFIKEKRAQVTVLPGSCLETEPPILQDKGFNTSVTIFKINNVLKRLSRNKANIVFAKKSGYLGWK